ncbi:RNA polymerase sigma-K factor precursor [compost metagenome]
MSLHDPIGTDKEGDEITLIDILGTEADDVVDRVQLKWRRTKSIKTSIFLRPGSSRLLSGASVMSTVARNGRCVKSPRNRISRSYVSRIEKRALMKLKLYHKSYKMK